MSHDVTSLLPYLGLDAIVGIDMETFQATLRHGWLARLSAPGYMDCTEWSAFDSFEAAATYLLDAYGDQM
jgi:hypothetical protein